MSIFGVYRGGDGGGAPCRAVLMEPVRRDHLFVRAFSFGILYANVSIVIGITMIQPGLKMAFSALSFLLATPTGMGRCLRLCTSYCLCSILSRSRLVACIRVQAQAHIHSIAIAIIHFILKKKTFCFYSYSLCYAGGFFFSIRLLFFIYLNPS